MKAALDEAAPAQNSECQATIAEYTTMVTKLQTALTDAKSLTNSMAESLAEIDPNTENGGEGKSLIKKMYKIKGEEPEPVVIAWPDTPTECVGVVAGKVIQIEDLAEDLVAAVSFRNFFGDVYCSAYVNSLVTMKDGLSQIFPGGLDEAIEDELQRAYGPYRYEQMNTVEIGAITEYFEALEAGSFSNDDSVLIKAAKPLREAINLCDSQVHKEIGVAEQDRDDYLNDYNFHRFLQTK